MGLRTKWDVLVAREEEATQRQDWRTALDLALLLADLDATPFVANGTGVCSKCRTPLPTEGDFARHFPVPDERYLNLGICIRERV